MSDNLNLPHLVQVCEAATPGEWKRGIGNDYAKIYGSDHRQVGTVDNPNDGTFIATFNPSTVLSLLRRLMETEEKVKGQQ